MRFWGVFGEFLVRFLSTSNSPTVYLVSRVSRPLFLNLLK